MAAVTGTPDNCNLFLLFYKIRTQNSSQVLSKNGSKYTQNVCSSPLSVPLFRFGLNFKQFDIIQPEYQEYVCCMRKQAWSPPGPGSSISKAPVNIDRLVMIYHSLHNLSVILWEQTAEAE